MNQYCSIFYSNLEFDGRNENDEKLIIDYGLLYVVFQNGAI